MSVDDASGYQQTAVEFAELLAARKYPTAYEMTSREYRERTTAEQLRAAFETIEPTDWGRVGPIAPGPTMTSWPGKQAADLGRIYVSIGGEVYSEAITVVLTMEGGEPRIREVEFGRP